MTTMATLPPEAAQAIAKTLEEHNLLDQFGVHQIHSHFPVDPDELMHEINDPQGRITITRPIKTDELPASARPTAWRFDASGTTHVEQWCCD